jgi:hypothetical protein
MVAHAPLVSILARAALSAKGLIEFLHSRSGLGGRCGNLAGILAKLSIQPAEKTRLARYRTGEGCNVLGKLADLVDAGLDSHGDERLEGVGSVVSGIVEVSVLDLKLVQDGGQVAGLRDIVDDLVHVLGVDDGGEGVDILKVDTHGLEEALIRTEAVTDDDQGAVELPVILGDAVGVDMLLQDGQQTLGEVLLLGKLGITSSMHFSVCRRRSAVTAKELTQS